MRHPYRILIAAAAVAVLVPALSSLAPGSASALQTISSVSLGGSGTISAGVPVDLTAQIGPNQTMPGSVSFTDNNAVISGCSDVTVQPGTLSYEVATCPTTYTQTGMHTIVASFTSSDPANSSAVSPPQVLTVLLGSTMTVSASPSTVVYGQPFTLRATVVGPVGDPVPTGTVSFFGGAAADVGGCTVTLANGTGTCTTPNALLTGTVNSGPAVAIVANYSGDANYVGSSGGGAVQAPTTIDIQPAPTTLTLATSVNPAYAGQPPNLTATIGDADASSGIPWGTVTFTVNGQTVCEPGSNGGSVTKISCQAAPTMPYTLNGTVVATFTGSPNGNYANATTAPIAQVVRITPTTVNASASPNPAQPGSNVALTASVVGPAGTPDGYVVFSMNNQPLCTAYVPTEPTCDVKTLSPGTHTITAAYADTENQVAVGVGAGVPALEPYANSTTTFTTTVISTASPVVGIASTPSGDGYWIVRADGEVASFGDASYLGSMYGYTLNKPIVGMAPTPDGKGYWLVASDGGIFNFGDANFYGSTGNIKLNKPIVGMTSTPDGKGYYFVASDGGIFTEGDAKFQGGMGGTPLNQPVVGMALDHATGGYWLVASDGGIFSFNAPFHGSTGALHLNKPIVGMEAASDGSGYRFVASDGGVFSFILPFEGSAGATALAQPIVGMAPAAGGGYWLVAKDGGVFSYDATFYGSGA